MEPIRFDFDKYVLLTECTPDLEARHDEYLRAYQPATPGERMQINMAVMAAILHLRAQETLTALVNEQIRTAYLRHDMAQEDEVHRYCAMLATNPGVAIVGLERSALGCRHLVQRHERLIALLEQEKTLLGNDRDELINLQGAKSGCVDRTELFRSESAYLTWVYTLLNQPNPHQEDIDELGDPDVKPPGMRDREPGDWAPPPEICRQLLMGLLQDRLAALRDREAVLRVNYEQPCRDEAEIRAQVCLSRDGMQLQRTAQMHLREHDRQMGQFCRAREAARRTGMLPGIVPGVAEMEGASVAQPRTAAPDDAAGRRAESARVGQARKEAADQALPRRRDGIGLPHFGWGPWCRDLLTGPSPAAIVCETEQASEAEHAQTPQETQARASDQAAAPQPAEEQHE